MVIAVRKSYVLILAVVIIIVGCIGAYAASRSSKGPEAYLMVKTDKTAYSIGEGVKVSIYFVNELDEKVILPSKSYGLEVLRSGETLLAYVSLRAGAGPIEVPPSTSCLIGEWVWNQRDARGNQVEAGSYIIRVNLLDAEYRGEAAIEIG